MGKRKEIQILGAVSAAAVAALLLALVGGNWDNLGEGTWRNTVVTWSMVVLIVSFTWLMVAYTKYDTPEESITPWKRVGRTALIVWGALAASLITLFIGVPVISGLLGVLQLALIPSALAFPVWTAIAAIRGRGAPQMQTAAASSVWEAGVPFTPVPGQAAPGSAYTSGTQLGNSRVAIVVVAVAGVIAAGSLLWLGDQWMRAQELNSMLNTVEQTEDEMVAYIGKEKDFYDAFSSWEMQTGRENAQRQLVSEVRTIARDLATELKVLEADWESISVLPWHTDLAGFRDDYTDHLNSWIATGEYYAGANGIEETTGPNPNSSDIEATFRIAGNSARDLSLPLFAQDAGQRITVIFRN